jgi:hypothetical protein
MKMWVDMLKALAPTGKASPFERKWKSECAQAIAATADDGDEAGFRRLIRQLSINSMETIAESLREVTPSVPERGGRFVEPLGAFCLST